MASEYLTVETCTLDFSTPGHTGTITILPASIKYSKVQSGGNEQYVTISFSITGFVSTYPLISNGTGLGIIVGSATKVKVNNGLLPVRENDNVDVVITDLNSPYLSTITNVFVRLSGQDVAKAV